MLLDIKLSRKYYLESCNTFADMAFRFRLYSRWKNDCHVQHPVLIRRRASLLRRSQQLMKRITKETVKQCSRVIGKLSHNCPGPVFNYVRRSSIWLEVL